MPFTTNATIKSFGGRFLKLSHRAFHTRSTQNFTLFIPPGASVENPAPLLIYLSDLTCSPDDVTEKGFLHAHAAPLGLALLYVDTSPRGLNLPGEHDADDFGSGASFYINSIQQPWTYHYRMEAYITRELPVWLENNIKELDMSRVSIAGHSMGGHGALTLYLKYPGWYKSVSAWAPIANPSLCPLGQKAFEGYLGEDREVWKEHDATELVKSWKGGSLNCLIDVGTDDDFYKQGQLLPENFETAVKDAGLEGLELRYQDGYDHSYFFISTFGADHVKHAAKALGLLTSNMSASSKAQAASPVSAHSPIAAPAAAPAAGFELEKLPLEVFNIVTTYLANRDIKNLRLASKYICRRSPLRLERVFLSANPRNVEVFLAIADHPVFREKITEIVWDDAQLSKHKHVRYDDAVRTGRYWLLEEGPGLDEPPLDGPYPWWFKNKCGKEMDAIKYYIGNDADRPDILAIKSQLDAQMSLTKSWEHYQELLEQQDQVLETGDDESALKYGLTRFPSLQRITITPAAHGFLFYPLYETPMIRAFPKGFRYPIPRGWPMPQGFNLRTYKLKPWSDEEEKVKWRGFCIVTRELANLSEQATIPKLVLDAHHLHTGLNAHIFEERSEEYDNLVKVIERPGFTHLDLDLLCEQQTVRGWPCLRNGLLKRALSAVKDPHSFSLRTVTNFVEGQRPLTEEDFIPPPLTFIPVDKWQNLNHFGLSRALVRQEDVLSLLKALPKTLRSVELSFLHFRPRNVGYQSLVDGMRNTLGWGDRIKEERPKVIIRFTFANRIPPHPYYDVNDAVTKYIHGERDQNPFPIATYDRPAYGTYMEHLAFLPLYTRPAVGSEVETQANPSCYLKYNNKIVILGSG